MKGQNNDHRRLPNWLAILFVANILFPTQGAQVLINLDLGSDYINPKTGFAATGQSNSDYWNPFDTTGSPVGVFSLSLANGGSSIDGITPRLTFQPHSLGFAGFIHPDAMYRNCYYLDSDITLTLTNFPAGQYDLYLYGHGGTNLGNTVFQVIASGVNLGNQSTTTNGTWSGTNWIEGAQYVVYRNVRLTNIGTVILIAHPGVEGQAFFNGVQISGISDPVPPIIVVQPLSQYASVGDSVEFSVSCIGTLPFTYRWTHQGTNILGATFSSMLLTNIQLADAGNYAVQVSNAYGAPLSSNAFLSVDSAPHVTFINIDVGISDRVKMGFAATGISNDDLWNVAITGPYQWFASVPNLKLAGGAITPIGLTVTNGLGLTGFNHPDAMYKGCCYSYIGSDVTLTLTNLPLGHYDFYLYGHAGADTANTVFELLLANRSFGNKSTASNGTWSLPNWVEGAQYVLYSNVRVTNGSPVIILAHPGANGYCYVNGVQIAPSAPSAPVISVQPVDQAAYVGADVTFSVTADGTDPLTYQWTFQETNTIDGATSSSLLLTNVQSSQVGSYSALITNLYGSVVSSNAFLILTNPPTFVRIHDTTNDVDQLVNIPVVLIAKGAENKVAFSLSFDPSRLHYLNASLGSGASGATLLVDTNQTGSVGAVLSLPGGATYSLGSHELVRFDFAASTPPFLPLFTPMTFGDIPTARRVSDAQDNGLDASFNSALITLVPLGPRPPLRIKQLYYRQVVISWPLSATNFILQEAPVASGPETDWTNSFYSPISTNGENVVTLPAANVSKYFRLFRP
jgi:hypothetical protein